MNGQKSARVLAGLAVLAVAVVAGISSYAHIESLALRSGYTLATARMLPLSVDGLIVASSMALLSGSKSAASRAGLILGIAATLAANVMAGARFGVTGALVNAWPAVAFIIASEILLAMARAAGDVPGADDATETVAAESYSAPADTSEAVADTVPVETAGDVPSVPQDEDTEPDTRTAPRRTRSGQTTADKVAMLRARHPDMTQAQMAARLKISERTVRRHLAAA